MRITCAAYTLAVRLVSRALRARLPPLPITRAVRQHPAPSTLDEAELMDPRPQAQVDALLRVWAAMDRLLSLLPTGSRPGPVPALPGPGLATPAPRQEDLAIQQAVDEVLEYHRTHRPKNTARNYGPKQQEWKVSNPASPWPVRNPR